IPGSLLSRYSPVPGGSVPLCWVTRYCSGVSRAMASGFLLYWRMSGSCGDVRLLTAGPMDLGAARRSSSTGPPMVPRDSRPWETTGGMLASRPENDHGPHTPQTASVPRHLQVAHAGGAAPHPYRALPVRGAQLHPGVRVEGGDLDFEVLRRNGQGPVDRHVAI